MEVQVKWKKDSNLPMMLCLKPFRERVPLGKRKEIFVSIMEKNPDIIPESFEGGPHQVAFPITKQWQDNGIKLQASPRIDDENNAPLDQLLVPPQEDAIPLDDLLPFESVIMKQKGVKWTKKEKLTFISVFGAVWHTASKSSVVDEYFLISVLYYAINVWLL
ncbi:hypothetical protein JTE90_006300 [Oedothorax gibbosus]|uniref:Uncharacterized protein n=1 Tax=Oedothorax gibbosus TaxID=931172 RepID=A0AAV6U2B2_9ARAC|nr:hypothetical protein JTE90_006300 [Oedothorax gibbosus]